VATSTPFASEPVTGPLELRPPAQAMRLARMGAAHQTRLSFLRALLRQLCREGWRFTRPVWRIDAEGYGTAVYAATGPLRTYSLVCFSHRLDPDKRTDRVIAEAWDATFALYDGVPDEAALARLGANVPRQEAGRYEPTELVLLRANRSVRLFDAVVAALAAGQQPDTAALEAVGYLMRTTAVYGNGKFGLADRDRIAGRPEFANAYRAELLSVWLARSFTVDLAEHLAAAREPAAAVPLQPALRRRLGVGNATGLGMAPYLVKHPSLLHRWVSARETALARVRAQPRAGSAKKDAFHATLARARRGVAGWRTDDPLQGERITALADDLGRLAAIAPAKLDGPRPWDALYRHAEATLTLEGQEMTVSLVIEPHGALVDDLADTMQADEEAELAIDGTIACGAFAAAAAASHGWTAGFDFARPEAQARFWYVSEEKLEPRLGERAEEPGAELEQPLATARDIGALLRAVAAAPAGEPLALFLLRHPEHRHAARRVAAAQRFPYGEIRDNLVGAALRPIDLLRFKLACFGATRFDPRSDRWVRIALFQGAPFPAELAAEADEGWIWGPAGPA
jgi:hypothetical protein